MQNVPAAHSTSAPVASTGDGKSTGAVGCNRVRTDAKELATRLKRCADSIAVLFPAELEAIDRHVTEIERSLEGAGGR